MDVVHDRIAKLLGSPEFFNAKAEHDLIITQALWCERSLQLLLGGVAFLVALLSTLTMFLCV